MQNTPSDPQLRYVSLVLCRVRGFCIIIVTVHSPLTSSGSALQSSDSIIMEALHNWGGSYAPFNTYLFSCFQNFKILGNFGDNVFLTEKIFSIFGGAAF